MKVIKPDIMKKEVVTFCLPRHVVMALKTNPNKSEIVGKILLDNMDRINDGSIAMAIRTQEIEIRDMVVKAIQDILSVDTAKIEQASKEFTTTLSAYRADKDELTEKICSRIYKDTEEYAKEMFII